MYRWEVLFFFNGPVIYEPELVYLYISFTTVRVSDEQDMGDFAARNW